METEKEREEKYEKYIQMINEGKYKEPLEGLMTDIFDCFDRILDPNRCKNLAEDLKESIRLHEEMVNSINEDLEKETNNEEDEKRIDEAVEKVMKNYDDVLRRLAK